MGIRKLSWLQMSFLTLWFTLLCRIGIMQKQLHQKQHTMHQWPCKKTLHYHSGLKPMAGRCQSWTASLLHCSWITLLHNEIHNIWLFVCSNKCVPQAKYCNRQRWFFECYSSYYVMKIPATRMPTKSRRGPCYHMNYFRFIAVNLLVKINVWLIF